MKAVAVLSCSVLRAEVEAILAEDYPDIQPVFLDSRLHMHPAALQERLEDSLSRRALPTLVLYGDCGTDMRKIDKCSGCVRPKTVNCCELMAGHELYLSLRNSQAFVLLPEWTVRWKEIFQKDLGFSDEKLARSFMHEYRHSLVYLDTGVTEIPHKTLQDIEAFFAMPVSIVKVGLEPLRAYIRQAVEKLREDCL